MKERQSKPPATICILFLTRTPSKKWKNSKINQDHFPDCKIIGTITSKLSSAVDVILSAGRSEVFLPLYVQTHLKRTAQATLKASTRHSRRSVPTLDLSNLGRAVLPKPPSGIYPVERITPSPVRGLRIYLK